MIPLKLTVDGVTKNLWQIFEPDKNPGNTEAAKIAFAISHLMFPTEVKLTSETYCRNSDRTANYELKKINNVNAKAKPEFTWSKLKAVYAKRLLAFLKFKYNYKDGDGNIQPEEAPTIGVTYLDFTGERTIEAYLGQTIDGTLVEYEESYSGYNYTTEWTQDTITADEERILCDSPSESGLYTDDGNIGDVYSIEIPLNQSGKIKVRLRDSNNYDEIESYTCTRVRIEIESAGNWAIYLDRTRNGAYEQFAYFSFSVLNSLSEYLTVEATNSPTSDADVEKAYNMRLLKEAYEGTQKVQYWENFRVAFPER